MTLNRIRARNWTAAVLLPFLVQTILLFLDEWLVLSSPGPFSNPAGFAMLVTGRGQDSDVKSSLGARHPLVREDGSVVLAHSHRWHGVYCPARGVTLKGPKGKTISGKRARDLLIQTEHGPDEALSRKAMCKAYALSDGSALLIVSESGRAIHYPSRDQLVRFYDDSAKDDTQRSNELAHLLPQGRNFVTSVQALIGDLPSKLRIDVGELDTTVESLERIDRAIRRLRTQRLLAPDVFAPLTAYIGEVIRRLVQGRWEMRVDKDGLTWIPWIVDRDGREYAPTRIYKELLEHGRSASVRTFVEGTVGARLMCQRSI